MHLNPNNCFIGDDIPARVTTIKLKLAKYARTRTKKLLLP